MKTIFLILATLTVSCLSYASEKAALINDFKQGDILHLVSETIIHDASGILKPDCDQELWTSRNTKGPVFLNIKDDLRLNHLYSFTSLGGYRYSNNRTPAGWRTVSTYRFQSQENYLIARETTSYPGSLQTLIDQGALNAGPGQYRQLKIEKIESAKYLFTLSGGSSKTESYAYQCIYEKN